MNCKLPLLKTEQRNRKKEVERYEKEIFRSNGTALSCAMMLTACSGSKPAETTAAAGDTTAAAAETTAAAAPSGDVQKLTMGTGGTTGTYYAYGGVIANVLNSKDIGVKLTFSLPVLQKQISTL